jgi:hypothetical protein
MTIKEQMNSRERNAREHFKDHKLRILQENDVANIYEFKNDKNYNHRLLVVFIEHYLFISGDLGEWAFNLTWDSRKLTSLPFNSREYFLEKLSRECEPFQFSPEGCGEFLKDKKADLIKCCVDEEEDGDNEEYSDEENDSEDEEDEGDWDDENDDTENKRKEIDEIFDDIETGDLYSYRASASRAEDELNKLGIDDVWEWIYDYKGELKYYLQAVLVGLELMAEQYKDLMVKPYVDQYKALTDEQKKAAMAERYKEAAAIRGE